MKKGISLISLLVIIIVLLILVGIVVISGVDVINNVTINTFAFEILNIQTAVDEYYYRHQQYPSSTSYELDTSEVQSESLYQFNAETITNGKISFKLVDLSLLGITDNKFGKGTGNDIYVLSEATGKVYYIIGVEYEETTYYTLVDELYTIVNIDNTNSIISTQDIKVYDVIFRPSEVEYTNVSVTVQVKLPSDATINAVTTTEGKSVGAETIQGLYKIVNVNETSTNSTGNYTIEVHYTFDGINKTAKYAVTNFDNTVPTISVTETESGQIKTVDVLAEDLESGIKVVKYVEIKTEDATYFQNSGKVLNNSQLKLGVDTEYTLYAEDKAGNYKLFYLE